MTPGPLLPAGAPELSGLPNTARSPLLSTPAEQRRLPGHVQPPRLLTGFSPSIFPEGLLAFSSDMEARLRDKTRERHRREDPNPAERTGNSALRVRHVDYPEPADAMERQAPPSYAGRAANGLRREAGPPFSQPIEQAGGVTSLSRKSDS